MLKITNIDDIELLIKRLNQFPNSFVFRGHADSSWGLTTTLERISKQSGNNQFSKAYEDWSMGEFKSKFHLYDKANVAPASKLEWLSLMQHYGVPTRLLDLTTSPFVALFFAVEAYDPIKSPDFSIYAFDYSETTKISLDIIKANDSKFTETPESIIGRQDEIFGDTIDRFNFDLVWITEPTRLNIRIDRQAGSFAVCGNRNGNIEDILSGPKYTSAKIEKIVIKNNLFKPCYALLRKMNISPKTIYGDLVGLAKTLALDGKIYSI